MSLSFFPTSCLRNSGSSTLFTNWWTLCSKIRGAKKVPWTWLCTPKTEKFDLCNGAQKLADQKDWKKLCFNPSLVFCDPLHWVCDERLNLCKKIPNPNKQKHKWQKANKFKKLKVVKAINFQCRRLFICLWKQTPTFHWAVQLLVYMGNEDGLSHCGSVAGKKELSLAELKAEEQFSSHLCTLSWRQSLGMGRFILKRAGRLHSLCFQTVEYITILIICIQLPSSPLSCCSRSSYIQVKTMFHPVRFGWKGEGWIKHENN